MNGRDYEKILDAIPMAAVFVVREDNREILYYNSRVKEAVPDVCIGAACYKLQMGSCAVCPIRTIGDRPRSRTVSYGSPFGRTVDIVATRTMWEDETPAFIITVVPHAHEGRDEPEGSREPEEALVRLREVTRTLGEQNMYLYAIDLEEGKATLVRDCRDSAQGWAAQTLMWDKVIRFRLAGHVHEDYREAFEEKFSLENLRMIRASGVQKSDMLCLWSSGGEYLYVAVIAYFSGIQEGAGYVVVAVQDVDKRVRQEQLQSRRDMQMAAIIKSRFNVMTTIHLEDDKCERFWFGDKGQPRDVLTGCYSYYFQQALDSTVHPEDREKFRNILGLEHMRKRAGDTKNYSEEICQYRKKGDVTCWLEQHVIYIRSGERVLVTLFGRDVTEEKNREEQHLKVVQEQTDIINSLGSMFFATYYADLEHSVFRSVTQLEEVGRLFGKETDYTAAQRLYAENFVHPEDRADYLYTMSIRNLRQVLRPEQPFVTFAYRKMPKDPDTDPENYEWIRATAVMARTNPDGTARGIVYAAQDVTESKRKEMREQRALQAACEAANRAHSSKSEFLSRMSHDMRTPMNGIIGMANIAASHLDDKDRVRDCLGKINSSGNWLLALVNEILEMGEIESGNAELVAEAFSLSGLMQEAADAVRGDARAKGVGLDMGPLRITHENVVGDRGRLKQVFLNILGNSVKFTPSGGLLEISAVEREAKQSGCRTYEFVFRDNGLGMEEEFVPHIFEPFRRADDSRISKIQGVGLGMTIAQNFVRMMGGTIEVKSRRGAGTQVTVTVFLKQQNQEEPAGETAPGGDSSGDVPFRGCRILVVDDNVINQEVAMEIIGATGAAVECASNGREGLELFEEMPEGYYDMIFMDIQMPVMNGYDAARAIRKLPRGDALSVPILALSANTFAEDIAASRQAGMNDHISKPFDISRLMACMERWLGAGE